MKAIILGFGSIGRRHAKNLLELGLDVRPVDIDEQDVIDDILRSDTFDFGLVCSPTNLHLEHTLKLAEYGIDFFCEKPFYAKKDLEIINKIRKLTIENNLINMIGCNMRFHPTIKSFDYSNVYNINVFFGYDLRKWHNDGKHLESYSANRNMGGGVLLDAIHEIDYLYNWFGEIQNISGLAKKTSDVTVDTEDVVDLNISFKNGTTAIVHLDYLQPTYTRYFETDGLERHDLTPIDEMYVDEMKYFINHIKQKSKCMNDIDDSIYLLDNIIESDIIYEG